MLTQKDIDAFNGLREFIFNGIKCILRTNNCYKVNEGALSIHFPDYFNNDPHITLILDCYVLGSKRHYSWKAYSLKEACIKAKDDIEEWIRKLE
jgi:hypothetical protein